MRIRDNLERKQRLNELTDVLDENTKSKAIDRSADLTIAMLGGTTTNPEGVLEELMKAADEQGSLTAREIAKIVNTDAFPINYECSWTIGTDE